MALPFNEDCDNFTDEGWNTSGSPTADGWFKFQLNALGTQYIDLTGGSNPIPDLTDTQSIFEIEAFPQDHEWTIELSDGGMGVCLTPDSDGNLLVEVMGSYSIKTDCKIRPSLRAYLAIVIDASDNLQVYHDTDLIFEGSLTDSYTTNNRIYVDNQRKSVADELLYVWDMEDA